MARYVIELDRGVCIGAGVCVAVEPRNWKLVDDGKADLLGENVKKEGEIWKLETDDLGNNLKAAQGCPVNCIHVYDNGKKLV